MIELKCFACGETVIASNRGGRKYCDVCKMLSEAKREKIRKEREERETAEYEEIMLRKRKEDPFDLSWKSLKRIDAEAKLFKMTYGTYTAACRSGFIRQILKDKGITEPEKMLAELEE